MESKYQDNQGMEEPTEKECNEDLHNPFIESEDQSNELGHMLNLSSFEETQRRIPDEREPQEVSRL